jgi:hypothetical protein
MHFAHESSYASVHIFETGQTVSNKQTTYGAALLATTILIIISKLLIAFWPQKSSVSHRVQQVFDPILHTFVSSLK